MKIGVLTSSRADYGIYLPLLQSLKEDDFFKLELIAFGTHLSKFHGYTIDNIIADKYKTIHEINVLLTDDSRQGIAKSYALTAMRFSDFWEDNSYDLVLCLGDRFEMSAAVQAGIPFEVKFAHLHGGETTLGAIDNTYRHQICLASVLHFTSAQVHSDKIARLLDETKNIHTVGALSLDEIGHFKPSPKDVFYEKYSLKDQPFALVTFHPETVSAEDNVHLVSVVKEGISQVSNLLNLVITMPNADTFGSVFRKAILEVKEEYPDKIMLIENFGKINYFNAMYYASLLIGNTSSGIIEAASFKKYVINVGNRQKGRIQSLNVINVVFDSKKICEITKETLKLEAYKGDNVYYKNGAVKSIMNILKKIKW
jgi:GDP/UDP-N,N'-diacetylbacillosamine 2-epimerase (hydrolysing)|tara:strand:- start:1933 stop:3039 length:1107 start_codon:yes stop_codon:yes gene_type:complete